MKILIASPTYDGSVRKEYMRSVMVLTDFLNQSGVLWEMMVEPSSMLHVMRSVMASKALMDPQITHILFVDTDMGFSASAVKKNDRCESRYYWLCIPLSNCATA